MSATDFAELVTAAGLAVPWTIVFVAAADESLVPSVAMNAPNARAAPMAAEATSAAARDACFMGGLPRTVQKVISACRLLVRVEVQQELWRSLD